MLKCVKDGRRRQVLGNCTITQKITRVWEGGGRGMGMGVVGRRGARWSHMRGRGAPPLPFALPPSPPLLPPVSGFGKGMQIQYTYCPGTARPLCDGPSSTKEFALLGPSNFTHTHTHTAKQDLNKNVYGGEHENLHSTKQILSNTFV